MITKGSPPLKELVMAPPPERASPDFAGTAAEELNRFAQAAAASGLVEAERILKSASALLAIALAHAGSPEDPSRRAREGA